MKINIGFVFGRHFILLAFLFVWFGVLISACGDNSYLPKPRSYPKIEFPEQKYQLFKESYCPFTFEYPAYASIIKDTSFFDEKPINECWYNINMNGLNGTIYCTYYPILSKEDVEKHIRNANKLVFKHQTKANYVDEIPIHKPNKVSGIVYDIQGPAACPFQFYLTDSAKHFLRASLYFNTQAKPDSLAPFFDFVKLDIMHLINTFKWKE